jgi:hypothetical protein
MSQGLSKKMRESSLYFFSRFFKLIVSTLFGVKICESSVLEDLAAFRTLDALIEMKNEFVDPGNNISKRLYSSFSINSRRFDSTQTSQGFHVFILILHVHGCTSARRLLRYATRFWDGLCFMFKDVIHRRLEAAIPRGFQSPCAILGMDRYWIRDGKKYWTYSRREQDQSPCSVGFLCPQPC